MPDPVMLLGGDAPEVVRGIAADLAARYGAAYRLLAPGSLEVALEELRRLKESLDQLALCLLDVPAPSVSAVALLEAARLLFPDARRVVLARGDAGSDAALAGLGLAGVHLHHIVSAPWTEPGQRIFPVLDELLHDWRDAVRLPRLRVADVMSRQVTRIRHDADLFHAAEIFALTGVADLMVVDEQGAFVGVISVGDALRAALPNIDEIEQAGGAPGDAFQLFVRKGRELSSVPILPLVIRDPLVCAPDDHITKVATVLIDRFIGRLPVLHEGRLVGTISRAEICWAVVGAL